MTIASRAQSLARMFRSLGALSGFQFLAVRFVPSWRDSRDVVLFRPRGTAFDLVCRPGTSDPLVLKQVFIDGEYEPLSECHGVDTILDCGANVGYSSAFFLSRFEGSKVVAIEPDPANFDVLEKNMAAFGDRVSCVQGAVWSHDCRVELVRRQCEGVHEWAWTVRETTPEDAAGVSAFSIPTLLDRYSLERVSILKMDIEGAEAVVFTAADLSWLSRVDAIAIELHENTGFGSGAGAFFEAIAGQAFVQARSGELVICTRRP